MIFPKQQMKIEQLGTPQLKKEALSLIIELYLNRKKDEDISFLKTNFGSTSELATGIKSSLEAGLDDELIEANRIAYGQNEKKLPNKCLGVRDYIKAQCQSLFFIISNVLLASCLILGKIRMISDLASSSIILLVINIVIACVRILLSCYCSFYLQKTSLEKTKNNLYQVVRRGHLIQIQESEIVVGDIVQLGFKQKAPATGLMMGSNQIYVKQNQSSQSTQIKSSLESCLKKIQKMSILQLKLSFENATLPSPIVIRGSELVKGSTFSILVISVTEQNLLQEHGLHTQDKFSNKNYDLWRAALTKKWTTYSIVIIAIIFIALSLTKITSFRLFSPKQKQSVDIFFELLHQISIFCLLLNVAPLSSYLNLIFMKLMTNLKTIQNFVKFFTVKRILCNEKKIIEHDQINIKQLAVCDKNDLISLEQIKNLDLTTAKIIYEVEKVFKLKIQYGDSRGKPSQIYDRIVHVKKKNIRVISVVSTLKKQIVFDQVMKQITKINDSSNFSRPVEYKGTFVGSTKKQIEKQKQKCGSFNFLKIPFRTQGQQNLKEIIHSKCRIKSRSVLGSLAGLAQNGMRTYYFQILDLKSLQDITHIISKGRLIPFTSEQKQKIVVMSRKMILVYGLTPIMIAYNQGTYISQPAQFLVCVFGANISENNEIISKLNYLPNLGIKSLIFINDFNQNSTSAQKQRQIIQQYTNRNWIHADESNRICSAETITNMLNRLVCRKCWIANCDCREKIEQTSNIQPFIELSQKLKIVYNTSESDLRYLESAYRQLDNNLICLDGQNVSVANTLDSIMLCLRFVQDLRKSVILFYAIVFICLLAPIISWLRGFEIVTPNQIGIIFVILIFCCSLAFMCGRRTSPEAWENTGECDDRIKITNRELFIKTFTVAILIIILTQLIRTLSFCIPEYADSYDTVMYNHNIDPYICKYGSNNSMTTIFDHNICSLKSTDFQLSQYSRISTFASLYIFCSIWLLIVVINRNLLSIWAVTSYTSCILMFVIIIEKLPWVLQSYSLGLTWQHYIIVYILALITVLSGWVIGYFVSKVPVAQYFDEETEIYIDLENQSWFKYGQRSYIQKLKYYQGVKKQDNESKSFVQNKPKNLLFCIK